jgi:NADH-quinone oxidoreductase subunit H
MLTVRVSAVVGVLVNVWLERKISAAVQQRIGPEYAGALGILQPMADGLKLLFKEVITPARANPGLYILGPVMTIMPALAAWVVIPFGPDRALANINAGLLLLLAITSLEVYGVILAGWASNSKYAFLGAMRASAQMVSYELAIGFALVVVLMVSGSLNLTDIVEGQNRGRFADIGLNVLSWNWLPLLPIFVVYFISGVAETNRHPFDVVEGESEIVAGHMIEYSGMGFAVFFLAEYANMILISALAAIMFLGGWAPFFSLGIDLGPQWFWDWFWLFLKTFLMVSVFIWIRASFPRYRYDQIMRLGWKIFIPVALVWLVVIGIWMQTPFNIWN